MTDPTITEAEIEAATNAYVGTFHDNVPLRARIRAALLAAARVRPSDPQIAWLVENSRLATQRADEAEARAEKAEAECVAAITRGEEAYTRYVHDMNALATERDAEISSVKAERDAARAQADALAVALRGVWAINCADGVCIVVTDHDGVPFRSSVNEVVARMLPRWNDERNAALAAYDSERATPAVAARLDADQQADLFVRGIWKPIATAPKDREIAVYCPSAHGLPHLVSRCQWHPDAGFCVCELREPTVWTELPEAARPAPAPTVSQSPPGETLREMACALAVEIYGGEPPACSDWTDAILAALTAAEARGAERERERCAGIARTQAESDEDYARRYPDEGDRNEQRAHRARSIEAAIRESEGRS